MSPEIFLPEHIVPSRPTSRARKRHSSPGGSGYDIPHFPHIPL